MKRVTLFISSLLRLATTLFTGCGDGQGIVEFTTAAQEVKIRTSSKAMTIDWGDGKTDSYTSTDKSEITHTYADNHSHTIRMTADMLTLLWCAINQLTTLDVSRNTVLMTLICSDNQLTALDVSRNRILEWLECGDNQLTALDVSRNTYLAWLKCGNNQLTVLDVSRNTDLSVFTCDGNQLTTLDVSRNTKLMWLDCYNNQLTALNVIRNTALRMLKCCDNQLTALDVSRNTKLTILNCRNNQLTTESLNALFTGLSAQPNRKILIENNPGSSTCDRSIATEKGWKFEDD